MENPHVSAGLDSSHDASMDSATRDLDNALNASQEPDEPSLATAAAAARVFSESSELQVPASLSAKWPPATRELDWQRARHPGAVRGRSDRLRPFFEQAGMPPGRGNRCSTAGGCAA